MNAEYAIMFQLNAYICLKLIFIQNMHICFYYEIYFQNIPVKLDFSVVREFTIEFSLANPKIKNVSSEIICEVHALL